MKAITIKQPWAHLICAGIKDVENRTWKISYRGRVLIHASGSLWKKIDAKFTDEQMRVCFLDIYNECMFGEIHFGAIIGSVEIIDCVQNHPSIWAEKDCWNWVLANPVLFLEPIPCKGKLSFWDYPGICVPELDDCGHKVCMCNIPVKEESQVIPMDGHFECIYCGGRWYK